MSEKLAGVRHRSFLERARETLLTTARQVQGGLPAAGGRRSDEVSMSALARALASPPAARLEELASAVRAGVYLVPYSDLSRSILREHLLTF